MAELVWASAGPAPRNRAKPGTTTHQTNRIESTFCIDTTSSAISLRLDTKDKNARSALECGSSSYRFPPSIHTANVQGGVGKKR